MADFMTDHLERIALRERLSLPAVDCIGQREPLSVRDAQTGDTIWLKVSAGLTLDRPSLYEDDEDAWLRLVDCSCLLDALDALPDTSTAEPKAVLADAKRRH